MDLPAILETYARGAGRSSPLSITAGPVTEQNGVRTGEIMIYGPIVDLPIFEGDMSAARFAREVEAMQLGEGDTLICSINSPGGFLDEAQAIVSVMRRQAARVVARIDGMAASAASIIAVAAEETVMPRNALMMMHNPWTLTMGDGLAHESAIEKLARDKTAIVSVYAAKSALEADEISAMMDAETWLSADEALEAGLIDRIATHRVAAAALAWDLGPFHYRRATAATAGRSRGTTSQGAPISSTTSSKRATQMPMPTKTLNELTLEALREARPDLVEAIEEGARAAAEAAAAIEDGARAAAEAAAEIDAAVEAERARIVEILDVDPHGHDDIVAAAITDPASDAGAVALRINAAERDRRTRALDHQRSDALPPHPTTPTATVPDDYASIPDVEARARAMYAANAEYAGRRARDYLSEEHFVAFVRGHESGRIRIAGLQR